MLSFLLSSCAAYSRAPFIQSKAHSLAFYFSPEMLLYSSPVSSFQSDKALLHHSLACNQCHRSFQLAPSTLWLAVPAATVFLPAFLLLSEPRYSIPSRQKYSHISRTYCSFSHHFQKPSHGAPFAPRTVLHCQFVSGFAPFAF